MVTFAGKRNHVCSLLHRGSNSAPPPKEEEPEESRMYFEIFRNVTQQVVAELGQAQPPIGEICCRHKKVLRKFKES